MNAYLPGTRVWYLVANTGGIQYAVVQSSSFLPDGTQILALKPDGQDKIATLPAAAVTKVS